VNDPRRRPCPKDTYLDTAKSSAEILNFEGLVDCSIDNLEDRLQIYEDKMAIGKMVNGFNVQQKNLRRRDVVRESNMRKRQFGDMKAFFSQIKP